MKRGHKYLRTTEREPVGERLLPTVLIGFILLILLGTIIFQDWLGEGNNQSAVQIALVVLQTGSTLILLMITYQSQRVSRLIAETALDQTSRDNVLSTLPILHFKELDITYLSSDVEIEEVNLKKVNTHGTSPQFPLRIDIRFKVQNVGKGVALNARIGCKEPYPKCVEKSNLIHVFTLLPGESIERFIVYRMVSPTGNLYPVGDYLGELVAWYWDVYDEILTSSTSIVWIPSGPNQQGNWGFDNPNYAPEVLNPERIIDYEPGSLVT